MSVKMVLKQKFDTDTLKRIIKELPEGKMKIGWDKDQQEENGLLTWKAAYLNEVGHNIIRDGKVIGHVVPRPFMALTAETNKNSWQQAWRRLLREYISDKKRTFRTIMNRFCQLVIEDIRHLVVDEKPFAPNYRTNKKTGKREFLNKTPLIDNGTMIAKLKYETHVTKG